MKNLIDRYAELTQIIKEIDLDISMSLLFGAKSDCAKIDSTEMKRMKLLAHLCEKVHVACDIIQAGERNYLGNLNKDFEQVAITIKEIMDGHHCVTEESCFYAYDLLLGMKYGHEQLILETAVNTGSFERRKLSYIPEREIEIFLDIAKYFYSINDIFNARKIINRLIKLSSERYDLNIHKEFITFIASKTINENPALTVGICEDNRSQYDNSFSEASGNYYWFYGSALSRLNDFSNSEKMFKKCAKIRTRLYGANNWFTTVAMAYAAAMSLQQHKDTNSAIQTIAGLIDRIEDKEFNQERNDYYLLVESELLCSLLIGNAEIMNLKEYQKYVEVYDKLCACDEVPNKVLINRKLDYNFWGIIYLKKGLFIKAEEAFRLALESEAPPETQSIISDVEIRNNLIHVFSSSVDMGANKTLLRDIIAILEKDEETGELSEKERLHLNLLILTIGLASHIEMSDEELSELTDTLEYHCEIILSEEKRENEDILKERVLNALRILQVFAAAWDHKSIYNYNIRHYLKMLYKVKDNAERYNIGNDGLMLTYLLIGLIKWGIGDSEAEKYLNASYQLSEQYDMLNQDKLLTAYNLMRYYDFFENKQKTLEYADIVYICICAHYTEAIKYIDGERQQFRLFTAQICYAGLYSVLRKYMKVEDGYELLLNHKQMVSLVEKERNKLLNSGIEKQRLYRRIMELRDSIVNYEKNMQYGNPEADYDKKKEYLRVLENRFSKQFPDNTLLKKVFVSDVIESMPDNSAIIEYETFSLKNIGFSGRFSSEAKQAGQAIDAYLIVKIDNNCIMRRFCISEGNLVFCCAREFLMDFHGDSQGAHIERKENMRKQLYKYLIKPVEGIISKVDTLIISPCFELINLPFGILQDDRGMFLDDRFDIVVMECARDFLFQPDRAKSENKALVIGNPQFLVDVKKGELIEDQYKNSQIPFAEEEARRVSNILNSQCIIGINATRQVFLMQQTASLFILPHMATLKWKMIVKADIFQILFIQQSFYLPVQTTGQYHKKMMKCLGMAGLLLMK